MKRNAKSPAFLNIFVANVDIFPAFPCFFIINRLLCLKYMYYKVGTRKNIHEIGSLPPKSTKYAGVYVIAFAKEYVIVFAKKMHFLCQRLHYIY